MIELYPEQAQAIEKLKSGSILMGGVGSGKSRTSLAYFLVKQCKGCLDYKSKPFQQIVQQPKDLYIITTAGKRDKHEWEDECSVFLLSTNQKDSIGHIKVVIDSWNNIAKYSNVQGCFFIFDQQRVSGKGKWAKTFVSIAKKNRWILLSATPGDNWSDYIPVFLANGFYRNRTDFLCQHAVYDHFNNKYMQISKYIGQKKLQKFRKEITVQMPMDRMTVQHHQDILVPYNKVLYSTVMKNRWDPYKCQPIQDISQLCYLLRKIVNSDPSRFDRVRDICQIHKKVIIFYNYDYQLQQLRQLASEFTVGEWNGHKHDSVPTTDAWVYLVQYSAGAEGWNCISTDTMVFYSQSYSYKSTVQAAGRIDRMNTPFTDLYYYHIKSNAKIDVAISKALKTKKTFNEHNFILS